MLLVVGSICLDRIFRCVQLPSIAQAEQGGLDLQPGGGGAVDALAAHRSGAPVVLAAACGDDEAARSLRKLLQAAGITAHFQLCKAAPTAEATTILDDVGLFVHSFTSGANSLLEADAGMLDLARKAELALFQSDANPRALHRLMGEAKACGAGCILHATGARPDALSELAPHADLIVCNSNSFSALGRQFSGLWQDDFEGEQLHALTDTRLNELCRSIAGANTDLILLMGARGAFVSSKEGARKLIGDVRARLNAPALYCAEEAFVGALSARLYAGDDLTRAVQYALAAQVLQKSPGGQDAILTKAEIQA